MGKVSRLGNIHHPHSSLTTAESFRNQLTLFQRVSLVSHLSATIQDFSSSQMLLMKQKTGTQMHFEGKRFQMKFSFHFQFFCPIYFI